jgi:hypothetical protein
MAGTNNQLRKVLYIAVGLPDTNDAAGFEEMTWLKVPGFTGGLQFGYTNADVTIPDIETGQNTVIKGAGTGASSTLNFRKVGTDAGVTALRGLAATASQGFASVKVVERPSGSGGEPDEGDLVQYAQGVFKDLTENPIEDSGYEGFSVVFQQNAEHVEDEEPAA